MGSVSEENTRNPGIGSVSVEAEPESPLRNGNNLPNFLLSIRLKYVKLGYHYLISNAMYIFLMPLIGIALAHLSTLTVDDFLRLWDQLKFNLVSVVLCSTLIVFLATLYFMSRPRPIYLVNFACYRPDSERKCTRE
ncbi:hypothetical protein CRG98_033531, partial [Punica granatum]